MDKERKTFSRMKQRCNNPNHHRYHCYGGRGIRVEYKSFQEFLSDVGPAPSLNHSLDRIDVNQNYKPGNCRWATDEQQRNNGQRSVKLTLDGKTQTIAQWARELGVREQRIRQRKRKGLSDKECLDLSPIERRSKGYGVYQQSSGKWRGQLYPKIVGTFDTYDEAVEACKVAKKRWHQ